MDFTKYKKMLKDLKKDAGNRHKEIMEKYKLIDNVKDKKFEKA